MERVNHVLSQAIEYRNSFDVYSYLWVQDRSEFMKQFLLYNHELTPEEIEEAGDKGVPESPPTLEQFKEQVCFFLVILVLPRREILILLAKGFTT